MVINLWDPEKNKLKKRNIKNPYRYHPVDVEKYPLNAIKMNILFKTRKKSKTNVISRVNVIYLKK